MTVYRKKSLTEHLRRVLIEHRVEITDDLMVDLRGACLAWAGERKMATPKAPKILDGHWGEML